MAMGSNEPLRNGFLLGHNTEHSTSEMGLDLQRKMTASLTRTWYVVNWPSKTCWRCLALLSLGFREEVKTKE